MALDRRISLAVQALGAYNDHGEYEPGVTVTHEVWAEVSDKSAFREVNAEGTGFDALRRYKVRWFNALDQARPDLVTVIDAGDTYTVTNIVRQAPNMRRRQWVYIEGELQERQP